MRAVLAAIVLASCGFADSASTWTENAVLVDVPGNDECFFRWESRPEDCFVRPPCAYYDAVLLVEPSGAGFAASIQAIGEAGAAAAPSRPTSVASAQDMVVKLSDMLSAGAVPTRPGMDYCVVFRPSQDLQVGDVVAIYRHLRRSALRHTTLFMELVDDPVRFAIVEVAETGVEEFLSALRHFAIQNGLEFSSQDFTDTHFLIAGDGFSLSGSDIVAQPAGSMRRFTMMLQMSLSSNGVTPTEAMMDRRYQDFTAAISALDGASVRPRWSTTHTATPPPPP